MPTGKPGTGPTSGRKRDRTEPPRRRGALSRTERSLIRAVALDAPGTTSAAALDRQVDRLARVLRRSPNAVRRALHDERQTAQAEDSLIKAVLRLGPTLQFVGEFMEQAMAMAPRVAQAGMWPPRSENAQSPESADGATVAGSDDPGAGLRIGETTVFIGVDADQHLRSAVPDSRSAEDA